MSIGFYNKLQSVTQNNPNYSYLRDPRLQDGSPTLSNFYSNPEGGFNKDLIDAMGPAFRQGGGYSNETGNFKADDTGRYGYTYQANNSPYLYAYDNDGNFINRADATKDNGPGDLAMFIAAAASMYGGAAAFAGGAGASSGAVAAEGGGLGGGAAGTAASGTAPSLSGTAFSGGMAPAGMGYSTGAGALGTGATSFGTGALGMDAAMGSFGAGLGAAGAAGGSGGGGGLNSMFDNPTVKQFGGKLLTSGLSSALSGSGGSGGSSNNSGGGFGNMGLSDLFNVGAGVYGAHQQNQAASKFTDWMNGQQDYIRNYGAPGSPEFNYLKQTLENQDAAAGRNSQYGTRATELLGKLGQAKLDASSRMALGFASPYQKALNQQANAGINVTSPLAKMLQGSGGNLSSLLNGLSSGSGVFNNGSNTSAQDTLNQIGPEGMPIDYGNGMADPTEQDVLEFLNNHPDSGEFMDWWS